MKVITMFYPENGPYQGCPDHFSLFHPLLNLGIIISLIVYSHTKFSLI
ncbi:MAG: hypothetical protein IPM71_14110 [Bacteroidota bacterium]|nr:MAG: hypothetical protein IPM71_14110 [Bacteroidota bacterium]